MIPYIEIINKTTLKRFALIEPSECWFELSYFEAGEFQIYCAATQKNIDALKKGNFVKIPNKRFIWYITRIEYSYTAKGAKVISAFGYEGKNLLSKRIIMEPVGLPTDLAQSVYNLVDKNIGQGASQARRILNVDLSEQTEVIESGQAPRTNLAEFVNNLLKNYGFGSQVYYDNGALNYYMFKGQDRTANIVFSQSMDNLLNSSYQSNDDDVMTYCLTVSKVDDIDYKSEYSYVANGVDRVEMVMESSVSTTYVDDQGIEHELAPLSQEYTNLLTYEAKKELANHIAIEEFNGEIDLVNSNFEFDSDFFIGDKVKVKDEYFKLEKEIRILKYTISQDGKKYSELAEYGE